MDLLGGVCAPIATAAGCSETNTCMHTFSRTAACVLYIVSAVLQCPVARGWEEWGGGVRGEGEVLGGGFSSSGGS